MRKIFLLTFLFFSCAHRAPAPETFNPSAEPLTLKTGQVATGQRFALASQGEATSAAGRAMLEQGGNAVDAFAAMSFTIGVERPHSTGIGGGGFALLKLAGWPAPRAFDFRERAPRAARPDMYLDAEGKVVPDKSTLGALSAGVPGLVAGVLELHARYGKLPRAAVLAPAIALAEQGFPVYPELARALKLSASRLDHFPSSSEIFLRSDGRPLEAGELLVQKDLAATLRAIARHGAPGFYAGPVARGLVRSQRRWGGLLTAADLKDYRTKERTPVKTNFAGAEVYSMPPPSSGGTHVIQMLGMLKNDSLPALGALTPASVHLLSSVMELAFRDRAAHLGDPDYQKVPLAGLQNEKYLAEQRRRVPPEAPLPPAAELPAGDPWPYESPETTHFSLLDAEGNAVSTTQTINGYFGSGLVAEGTGVLFNNEMDDFGAKVGASNIFGAIGGKANLPEGGKRPLSSMAPTIVERGGKPVFATGSPSGTRIISCVFLSLVNHLGFGLPLEENLLSPRFHHQWMPGKLYVEARFPAAVAERLRASGHPVEEKDLGCRVEAVAREADGFKAVADPRGFGAAAAE